MFNVIILLFALVTYISLFTFSNNYFQYAKLFTICQLFITSLYVKYFVYTPILFVNMLLEFDDGNVYADLLIKLS